MSEAYLGLGSNLGNRRENLCMALRLLGRLSRVDAVSSLYETQPVGGPAGQSPYFNAACSIEVNLEPQALLRFLKNIEHEIGRRDYGPRWGPRVIDLDILLLDQVVLKEDGLEIPHPRLTERAFVLVPLLEIDPELAHPLLAKPLRALLTGLDSAGVKPIAARGWEGELQKEDRLEL